MRNKIKKNKYQIIELILIFIATTIVNLTCNSLKMDEVWNYGFSYNISNGLIPYKDFNMVITPLFPLLNGLIMKILGKNIIIFHLINSLICTLIFFYLKKFNSTSHYLAYGVFLCFSSPNYNILCLLLMYLILTMEDKKNNNYLIGIILGLIFLTKQNVGIFLCIPTLFTKNITKIIKRILGFIIPNLLLLIYLLINNCLYEFIDYVFLGIKSFSENNVLIETKALILLILSIIYLVYKYLKTKDIKIIYYISIFGLSYPIIDMYHVAIPLICGFNYCLSNQPLNLKCIRYAFIFFIVCIISLNTYQYMYKDYTYPNQTLVFKYRKINNEVATYINKVNTYIKDTEGRVFIINPKAYLFKLELHRPLDKFDLLNNGNMGLKGESVIIDELKNICSTEKCTFLLDKNDLGNKAYSQYNQKIYDYIINNYNEKFTIYDLTKYTN